MAWPDLQYDSHIHELGIYKGKEKAVPETI